MCRSAGPHELLPAGECRRLLPVGQPCGLFHRPCAGCSSLSTGYFFPAGHYVCHTSATLWKSEWPDARWRLYANRFVQTVGPVCRADGHDGFIVLLALLISLFGGKQYAVTTGLAIDSSLAALWQPATNWPDSGQLPLGAVCLSLDEQFRKRLLHCFGNIY